MKEKQEKKMSKKSLDGFYKTTLIDTTPPPRPLLRQRRHSPDPYPFPSHEQERHLGAPVACLLDKLLQLILFHHLAIDRENYIARGHRLFLGVAIIVDDRDLRQTHDVAVLHLVPALDPIKQVKLR